MAKFAEVVVAVPAERTFSYGIPSEIAGEVKVGIRVLVPFGNREIVGYVVGLIENISSDKF